MASHVLFFPLILLFLLNQIPPYSTSSYYYTACSNNFSCGTIKNIGFPFFGNDRPKECGHPGFYLNCTENLTYITINGVEYLVKDTKPENQILRIARKDYLDDLCPSNLNDSILDRNLFDYGSEHENLRLFYGCSEIFVEALPAHFTCSSINGVSDGYGYPVWDRFGVPKPIFCGASVVVPVDTALISWLDFGDSDKLQEALRGGFVVKWTAGVEECENCGKSKGVCGYDWRTNRVTCYFDDQTSATPDGNTAAIAGGVSAGVALVAIALGIWLIRRRKKRITER